MSVQASTFETPPDLTSFGHEIWWVILVKVVAVFLILVLMTLFTIVAERIVVARMQQRIGPNRVGPRGSLQSLADGVKLMLKEDLIPAIVDKPVYILAPILSTVPAFLAFSVVPFGPNVSIGGHHTALQLTDLPVGVLWILAMSSLGVYGIILSGWSSGSAYPLLGSLRSAAQVISYEVGMGLALVPIFIYSGTLSTSGVVASQEDSLVRLVAAGLVHHLRDLHGRRDQPRALRPPGGRVGAGRRLPHRVLVDQVRALLPRRVRQHGHRFGAGDDPLPRRLASGLADQPLARGEHGLLPDDLVHHQGPALPVPLHLAARNPAAAALRPVHAVRLEAADSDRGALDHDRGRVPDRLRRGGRPNALVRRFRDRARRGVHHPDDRSRRTSAPRTRRGGGTREGGVRADPRRDSLAAQTPGVAARAHRRAFWRSRSRALPGRPGGPPSPFPTSPPPSDAPARSARSEDDAR